MAYYRDSSAYDFSLFEPQAEIQKPANAKKTQASRKTPPKKQTKSYYDGNAVRKINEAPAKKQSKIVSVNLDDYQHTVKRNSTSAQISLSVKKMMAFGVLCFGFIFCLLFMNAQYDSVTSQISEVNNQIDIAEGECVRLNAEINSRISTDKVEKYAENVLGMVKAESYQITYLDLSEGDKIVVSGDKTSNKNGSLSQKVKSLFAYIF